MSFYAHQRECVEIWLTYYGGGYFGKHEPGKQPLDRKKKRGSRIPLDLLWLEAILDADISRSNLILQRVVMRELPAQDRALFRVIDRVYLNDPSDIGAPERWRTSEVKGERDLYKMHEEALDWIVERCGKRSSEHLSMVEPEEAVDLVEKSARKRLKARSVFFKQLERTGDAAESRRLAAKASGLSVRQVQRYTKIAPSQVSA